MSIHRCQLAPQFGDVHLVRDAIRVADALHITVLHHFLQASQHRNARQLQRVCDLTCANGRAHDGSQEDVDADGSVGQAGAVGRTLRVVVVAYGGSPASIRASVNNDVSSRAQPTLLNCLLILNEGCSSSTRATAVLASLRRESFTRGAASST